MKIKLNAAGERAADDATDHILVFNTIAGLHETVRAPGFEHALDHADAVKALQALNDSNYLGVNDWRFPKPWEALTQVLYVNEDVMADLAIYPDMQGEPYWTDQDTPWSSDYVFCVGFDYGSVYSLYRLSRAFVRPVRSVSPGQ